MLDRVARIGESMFKKLLLAIMIVTTTGLMGMSNQEILENLDYSIESSITEKMEDQEFSQYYNISISQINMYKIYLNKINYTLRDLDKYLNLRIKKRLFLEKILPLDTLKVDDYSVFEEYQYDLFKLLKKKQIKNMMSPNNDYRMLFIYMIENRLEVDFWQDYMINEGNLSKMLNEDKDGKNKIYNYIATQNINLKIENLGGMKNYGDISINLINDIIFNSGSSGGDADPLDKVMKIPDNWTKGDRIRLSNYLKKSIYDKVVPGDMLLIDNGNSEEGSSGGIWPWQLGYYDHAIMVTSKSYETPTDTDFTARHNNLGIPLPEDNAFIGAWNKYGVIYEKRYLYQYVYVSKFNPDGTNNDDYNYDYERIRKPHSQVIAGKIAEYRYGDIRPPWDVAKWSESKIGHDYGIFGPSCTSDEANYTCASLAWCAYKEILHIDIDINVNGSVYVDDIRDYIYENETEVSHIIYDSEHLRAHFECPDPIDETDSHYIKYKNSYDWAVWNFTCPEVSSDPNSQCEIDFQECLAAGAVYSPFGNEGECYYESCGHTEFCEYSTNQGKSNPNDVAEYMLNIVGYRPNLNPFEAEMISICGDNLFDKDLFPDLTFNGCIGENITGGTEEQDYVQVLETNCSKERVDEFCDENSSNYSNIHCFMKSLECLSYVESIRTECPYLHEIRRYGCDAENTDGLDEIISKYEQLNCSNLSLGDTHYTKCQTMSREILELCPQYIEGNEVIFSGE